MIEVYAPTMLEIKRHPSCVLGQTHFFHIIERSRFLSTEIRRHIAVVLQNNAYFAHPENVLLAMTNDDRASVRELAWFRIMAAKESNKNDLIRTFRLPKIKLNTTDYVDLIDWSSTEITSQP